MNITNDKLNEKIFSPFMKIMNDYASMYSKPIIFSNEIEVTFAEVQVLIAIHVHNITKPVDLSEYLHISKPAVTKYIKKLKQKNLINKQQSHSDYRSYDLELTHSGECIFNEYSDYMNTLFDKEGKFLFESIDEKTMEYFAHFFEISNNIIDTIRKDIKSMSKI